MNAKPTPAAADDGKILGIELLRFACALAVLVFHYQHLSYIGTDDAGLIRTAQPFYDVLGFFYRNGFWGVEVFWCISGFIFFWKYGQSIAVEHLPGARFFWLRFSRLYPLHLATLLFVAVLQWVYRYRFGDFFVYHWNDAYHFALQLVMGSNWGLQQGDSFNGPIWSISIEVLVYGVFFLSLRYLSGRWPLLVALLVISMAVQALNPAGHPQWQARLGHAAGAVQAFAIHPFFACVMYFYAGCLTAVAYRWGTRGERNRRVLTGIAVAIVLLMLASACWYPIAPKYYLLLSSPAAIYLCVALLPDSPRMAAWLVPAGNMTYSSYLLHVPVQLLIATVALYAGWTIPFYQPWFFIAFMAATLALSHWTYDHFEMPAQRWIRRRALASRAGAPGRTAPTSR